jgi:translation elongation factor EF-4
MDVIITSPQVTYKLLIGGDKVALYPRARGELVEYQGRECTYLYISNPEDVPKPGTYIHIEEPIAKVEMITPNEYIGNLMGLAQERR